MSYPTFTIATVCYNAEEVLEETMLSVLEQSYPNIAYLVIDGNSKDNTVALIEQYASKLDDWVSEPDRGIYDAMNKAIQRAKGDYILFMNAGDTFVSRTILEEIATTLAKENIRPDVIYGDYNVVNQTYTETVKAEPLHTRWRGMKFCHQSMLLKTDLAKTHLFSGNYITSDFEQVYNLYREGASFYYFPKPIANFKNNGLNTKHKIRVRFEAKKIVNRYDKSWKTNFAFWQLILWTCLLETLRQIIPQTTFERIEQLKTKIVGGRKKIIISS